MDFDLLGRFNCPLVRFIASKVSDICSVGELVLLYFVDVGLRYAGIDIGAGFECVLTGWAKLPRVDVAVWAGARSDRGAGGSRCCVVSAGRVRADAVRCGGRAGGFVDLAVRC